MIDKEKPKVVKIHDVNIDKEYAQWLNDVKGAIPQCSD